MEEIKGECHFRSLYSKVLGYKGTSLSRNVLEPAAPALRDALEPLRYLRNPGPLKADDHSWTLYALSRINDLLLLSFQPVIDKPARVVPVSTEEYARFWAALGCELKDPSDFEPFFHEIVSVNQVPTGKPAVDELLWPALLFGEMLLSRAGARVSAGIEFIKKDLAEQSVLYFSHRRLHRPTCDGSEGWGSNSQWRTRFRRDYQTETEWQWNVDGKDDIRGSVASSLLQRDLTAAQRLALLKYRCWVNQKPSGDDEWFPFTDRYTEQKEEL